MLRYNSPLFALTLTCSTFLLMSCDEGETLDGPELADRELDPNPSITTDLEVEAWESVSLTQNGTPTVLAPTELPPEQTTHSWWDESFVYAVPADTIAVTSAPGGLFPPSPADIPLFTEPELANGFLAAVKIHDVYGDVIGFGTEQEVLDLPSELGETTYTLTLPERGTLMLAQTEDLAPFLAEINDMIATNDLIRSYDPPMVIVNSIPGTGRIIGGTGEFEHADGHAREIGVTHEINLIEGSFDLEVIVQVKYGDCW